ncbi:MAG: squalene/phytoene synthase family protein [Alphaproteobacteria bacterium]|nr:MAG: squalene/phytoene synthase family protein [Alphaproteobacteria bacterium]
MQENYRHCEALVRAADKDRYLAALFAPADRRGPLFALHAFNHEIASIRDRAREPMPGEIRLQWWRDVLGGERAGEAAAHPVAAPLRDVMARFDLPAAPLIDLVEAHAFDLYDDPMPTLAALEGYARKTEAALFGMAARIVAGHDDGALAAAADHAGIAHALTALLRSFAHHASRRQIFVPLELLQRRGVRVEHILAGQTTPELREALADVRAEARRHLDAFGGLLAQLPAASVPVFLPAALAPGYLAVMDRPDYDPFRSAVQVPQWRRQWTLWRAARRWARTMPG